MSFIKQIAVDQADGVIKKVYDAASQRADGVANIIQVMSLTGNVCRASMGMYVASVKNEATLDRTTRELLATVVSNVNDCYY